MTAPPGEIVVDGRPLAVDEETAAWSLAEFLRHRGVTAVKLPCGEGACGGCTVQVDGVPTAACILPAGRAVGRRIRTATELGTTTAGSRLARHLAVRGGLQCGFCIPGLLASAAALIEGEGGSDAGATRAALASHLCRCTGYDGPLRAVHATARAIEAPGACPRPDGWAKATGAARYAADSLPPGHLVGVLLTSRSPHCRVRIEPGTAMAVPGAVAVLSPRDAPLGRYNVNPHVDDPVLAPPESRVFNQEARFVGDIVGMVVAADMAAARRMAARVTQTEEPLPAVLTPEAASAPGAPPVNTELGPNVAFSTEDGATAEATADALARSPLRRRATYRAEGGPVGAMERLAAGAEWIDGRCRVWSTSQLPSKVAHRIAPLLGLETGAIDVHPLYVGGGFGGKEEVFLEPMAAVASRACDGRPVLVEATRAQVSALRRRHAMVIDLDSGYAHDGTPLVRSLRLTLDAGAEVSHSPLILLNAMHAGAVLYPAAVLRVGGAVVLTNTTPSGAFRGFGAGEVIFAIERNADETARAFGIDRLEYRRRHVLRAGGVDPVNDWPVASFASGACLDEAERRGWHDPLPQDPTGRWVYGRGLAQLTIVTATSSKRRTDFAGAACRLEPDGTVVVETSVVEMGQGIHASFISIVAERLGVDPGQVRVERLAPDRAPEDEGTYASRGVYVSGNALAIAADALGAAMQQRAAGLSGVPPAACRRAGLSVEVDGTRISPADLGPLRGTGSFRAPDAGLAAGVQMADVAVDTRTGRVQVERVVSIHDVGRLIDRQLATGQVIGGVVQGIGLALTERCRHDADGQPLDIHLLDQGLPNWQTAPEIIAAFVGDTPGGPLGAKGIAEAPVVGVVAAIANAVCDATGVSYDTVPLHPERVLAGLRAAPAVRSPSTKETHL